jgi:formylglycine-generating enzyme required for sulfatase activity
VLFLAGLAWADAASDYKSLFGDEEKAATAKGLKAAPEFAAKMLAAAKTVGEQKDLQTLLYEKAYEFGMKAPAGHATAIEAMKLLIDSAPEEKRAASQEKLLSALQVRHAKATGDDRKRMGEEIIALLVTWGDAQADAQHIAEANTLYRRAWTVASAGQSPRTKEILEKIRDLTAAQESDKRIADLKAKLEKDPRDPAARAALIVANLGELDQPAEAARLLTVDVDESLRTYVPLAAKKVDDLDEAICIQLAEWYASLAEKASPAGKGVILGRAKECCQRFLVLHTTQDAALLKCKMLQAKVDKALEKAAPPPQPRGPMLALAKGVKIKLVPIPAGSFLMGSPAQEVGRGEVEGPQYKVTISKPFQMGATEVTQEQYEAIMGKNPSSCKGPANPVEQVSWEEAMEFCKKVSAKTGQKVRLPTEAEWEYACRAGTKTRFYSGDEEKDLADCGWYIENSGKQTHPVGEKKPNAFGLFDMHGNVWEWCADWYAESYLGAKAVDPTGPATGTNRVVRGGCWLDPMRLCRSAIRFRNKPDSRSAYVGFRVVVGGAGEVTGGGAGGGVGGGGGTEGTKKEPAARR